MLQLYIYRHHQYRGALSHLFFRTDGSIRHHYVLNTATFKDYCVSFVLFKYKVGTRSTIKVQIAIQHVAP